MNYRKMAELIHAERRAAWEEAGKPQIVLETIVSGVVFCHRLWADLIQEDRENRMMAMISYMVHMSKRLRGGPPCTEVGTTSFMVRL